MKILRYTGFITVFLFLALVPLSSLTLKLGSVAPAGSDWDLALKEMANEWRIITNGQVQLKIYAGGIAGDEENMIQKMRIGQLDMAILSAIGMNEIVPESLALSLPFLLEDDEEVAYMLENIAPIFDDDFQEKGFEVLLWSTTGWIHFFSKERATSPDLLRRQKIAVSATEPIMADAWKSLNFHVIPIGINDTLSGLQSGMIDVFYAPPMAAAAYQWFSMTPHMSSLPLIPLLGGIVISERTWNRIPARYHEELRQVTLKTNSRFSQFSEEINDEALKVMKEYGLTIDELTEEEKEEWKNLFSKEYSPLVGPGKHISSETLHTIQSMLNDFRTAR
jgi:TRAP-type C4-dicarboxylate transport system substrate-binding protein